MAQPVEPPPFMQLDEPEAADQARRRLLPRRSFPAFFRRKLVAKASQFNGHLDASPVPEQVDDWHLATPVEIAQAGEFVDIDNSAVMQDNDHTDVYRWAIVCENQRGSVRH
jgi:hypothetical protein